MIAQQVKVILSTMVVEVATKKRHLYIMCKKDFAQRIVTPIIKSKQKLLPLLLAKILPVQNPILR